MNDVAALVVPNVVAATLALMAAVWTTGRPERRAFGVALALTALAPAWWMPAGYPLLRGFAALLAFSWVLRVIDLRRGRWSPIARLRHAASIIDTRRLRPVPRHLATRDVGLAAAWSMAFGVAYVGLAGSARVEGAPGWLLRWASALVLVYAGVAAMYATLHAAYAAVGFETGPLHVAPARSRSVQELWGERWAKPVSAWLHETFFRPLGRRRYPRTGALVAFCVSAGFHAYAVWVALGFLPGRTMAAWMILYFLAQTLVIGLEGQLAVRSWSAPRAHAWTVCWMLLTAPLFLEPAVQVLGFAGR